MNAKLYKTEKENYVLVDPTKGTYDDGYTLGTSRESQYNKLSLKNCQAIERGYDLDELAEKACPDIISSAHSAFKAGFQKALELMADKKFSEQDMYKMFIYGRSIDTAKKHVKELEDKPIDEFFNDFIQSLQQNEWEVEVEMEKVKDETKIVGAVKGVKGSGNKITTYKSVPKLDLDGCLILKR